MSNPLIDLLQAGQSFWLDNIRREWLDEGVLTEMVENRGLRGLTSNPAIFHNAITSSTAYDRQIAELSHAGAGVVEIYEALVVSDIRRAADVLRPVWDASNGADGYVSLEVAPTLAHDTQGSIDEARRLFADVDRPNVMIKIPGTAAGLPAIETLIAEGIPVNVTLLFSTQQYEGAAMAYIRGLETRRSRGGSLNVASVASVFLSRIDSLVDGLLGDRILPGPPAANNDPAALMGRVALAEAKATYARFEDLFRGERFAELAAAGAWAQRPLWASTSTKNPFYPDVLYVEPLIGTETVNTMPDATANAFEDHGMVAEQAVRAGIDEALDVLEAFGRLGFDLDHLCQQLQDEGVRKFLTPFGKLIASLSKKRTAVLAERNLDIEVQPGAIGGLYKKHLGALEERRACERLWSRDHTLWGNDEETLASVSNRLGWTRLPAEMPAHVASIAAWADEVRGAFDCVVLLGMGGSSLTTDVAATVFGRRDGYPALRIVDTTHPDHIAAVTETLDLDRTLFIVASKSGGTIETMSLYHHFRATLDARVGRENAGQHFVAVTDDSTALGDIAREGGFRKVFINPTDIGGRYSALSWFGLVPMALGGIDIAKLIDRTCELAERCGPHLDAPYNPAAQLGAFMSAGHAKKRCVLNLIPSSSLTLLGDWLEQLIAESLGKRGRGVLPVTREPLGDVGRGYGAGRLFAFIRTADEHRHAAFDALAEAGHPVVDIALQDTHDIGQVFLLFELATAFAAVGLSINPFDEPDVRAAKAATGAILERGGQSAALTPLAQSGNITVFADAKTEARDAAGDVATVLRRFLAEGGADHDYVALTAFVAPSEENLKALETLRGALRHVAPQLATTVGVGPRYLHSIGQLYKGGHNCGLHIQVVDTPTQQLAIPGQTYDFNTLIGAQALGDYHALVDKHRRIVRLVVEGSVVSALGDLADALI